MEVSTPSCSKIYHTKASARTFITLCTSSLAPSGVIIRDLVSSLMAGDTTTILTHSLTCSYFRTQTMYFDYRRIIKAHEEEEQSAKK